MAPLEEVVVIKAPHLDKDKLPKGHLTTIALGNIRTNERYAPVVHETFITSCQKNGNRGHLRRSKLHSGVILEDYLVWIPRPGRSRHIHSQAPLPRLEPRLLKELTCFSDVGLQHGLVLSDKPKAHHGLAQGPGCGGIRHLKERTLLYVVIADKIVFPNAASNSKPPRSTRELSSAARSLLRMTPTWS